MNALLRRAPARGDLVAAGAVALTIAVGLINLRFEDEWGVGVHFVYSAVAAVAVLGLAATADRTADEAPPAGIPCSS
jgi:hypothetical protein